MCKCIVLLPGSQPRIIGASCGVKRQGCDAVEQERINSLRPIFFDIHTDIYLHQNTSLSYYPPYLRNGHSITTQFSTHSRRTPQSTSCLPNHAPVARQTTQHSLGHFRTLDREEDQESNDGSIAGCTLSTASNCISCLNHHEQQQMVANAYFHPLSPIPGNKLVASTYFFTGVSSLSGRRYVIYTESLHDEALRCFLLTRLYRFFLGPTQR